MYNLMALASLSGWHYNVNGDGHDLLRLLVHIVVIGLVFWLLWWFIGYVRIPEPFNKVARVLLGLFAVLFLIGILLSIDF